MPHTINASPIERRGYFDGQKDASANRRGWSFRYTRSDAEFRVYSVGYSKGFNQGAKK